MLIWGQGSWVLGGGTQNSGEVVERLSDQGVEQQQLKHADALILQGSRPLTGLFRAQIIILGPREQGQSLSLCTIQAGATGGLKWSTINGVCE